ncbi:ABC transporter substrate-binding protein [Pseudalkalibacillus sp. R45]|uniref:ABC transporter substrate-binding protein n=1 Tax=Pseudalkalibacillus sp. R45 TaxID=3457433 RepID=UPI003FCC58F8
MKSKLALFMMCILILSTITLYSMPKGKAAETDTIKIGWTSEPDSISPFIAYSISSTEIFKLVYDPLVGFNDDVEPVGRLAKDWKVSNDNLTWTFKLEENVKWHDGEPFTSKDVKFTYETLQESGLGLYAEYLKGIESIETPDEHTVVIKTKEPKANMLQMTTPILPEHIWKDVSLEDLETWPNDKPIGTGAFKFEEWKKDEFIKLSKNDDYFYKKPHIEELIFVLYANNDTMVQSLKKAEIDGSININANQVKPLSAEETIDVVTATTHGFTELAINTWSDSKSKGNPLLKDKKIRQAMSYAIDKQKLIDVAYSGQGTPGTTLIPPSLDFWHYEPSNDELRKFDPSKAEKLLKDAGYKDSDGDGIRESSEGEKLNFRLFLRADTSEEVRAGQMIGSMLEKVGIGTEIETVDDGLLSDKIYDNANFDMFIWGWGTDADPTTILNVMAGSQIGNLSDSYYSNSKYDELLEKQSTILDRDERQKIVHEMQQILYNEAPYIILTYDNALQAVRTDKWEGWTKVRGTYFYSFNHHNYLNVKPADGNNGSTEAAADTSTGSDSASNNGAMIGAVVGGIIILALVAFLFAKRKKATTIEEDM